MSLLQLKDITFRYGRKTLFEGINATIHENTVIGLVGNNGTGKSTLLKVMTGQLDIDEGEMIKANSVTISYVQQDMLRSSQTVEEYLFDHPLAHSQPELYRERIENLKAYFALPSDTPIDKLSGGQNRQVCLMKAFAIQPSILLLDEPTNHLDITSLLHFQKLLQDYPHTVVMISHDRYFLDKTLDAIWEIEDHKLYLFDNSYTEYVTKKDLRRRNHAIAYEKATKELNREHEWYVSGVKARSTKDTGRMTRYFELRDWVKHNKPNWRQPTIPLPEPPHLGNKILNFKHVDISMPHNDTLILEDFHFDLVQGMRIGLLGRNGSGKTTFLNSVVHEHPIAKGKIIIGKNTHINYHDQHREEVLEQLTIHEYMSEGNVDMKFGEKWMNVYKYMKHFLFDSQDLKLPIHTLSGGQKARVLLAQILKQGGNLLILDEPTNDLDIDSLDALEYSLKQFESCMLVVSHDRYFLDSICTHILGFEGNGNYTLSSGGYSEYIAKYQDEETFWSGAMKALKQTETKSSTTEVQEQSQLQVDNKAQRKIRERIRVIEKRLAQIETHIAGIQKDIAHLQYTTREYITINNKLNQLNGFQIEKSRLEDEWLRLGEKLPTV